MAVEFIKRTTNSTAIVACPVSGYHTYKLTSKQYYKTGHSEISRLFITKIKLS